MPRRSSRILPRSSSREPERYSTRFSTGGSSVAVVLELYTVHGALVSLGAVINGEVSLGSGGFLGEFGHIQAVNPGTLCYCGHTGCLETVTKETYIIEKAIDGLKNGVHSEIRALSGDDPAKIRIADLKTAASNGDRFCKLIFEEVAGYIGPKLVEVRRSRQRHSPEGARKLDPYELLRRSIGRAAPEGLPKLRARLGVRSRAGRCSACPGEVGSQHHAQSMGW